MICHWMSKIVKHNKWCYETRRYLLNRNVQALTISNQYFFVLVTWSWPLPEDCPDACCNLTTTYHTLPLSTASTVALWELCEAADSGGQDVTMPCTGLELTWLRTRQLYWWIIGIRSNNLHFVVEYSDNIWRLNEVGDNSQTIFHYDFHDKKFAVITILH